MTEVKDINKIYKLQPDQKYCYICPICQAPIQINPTLELSVITCKHQNLYPKQTSILIYCVKCQCTNEFYLTQSLKEKAPQCKGGQSPSKKQQKLNQDKLSVQNNFAQTLLNQNITYTANQQVKQQKQFEHIQVLIISQQIVQKSYHHSTFETILVQIQNLKCNQCNEQFKKLQIEINQQNQTYFIIQLECENRKCKAELNVHCQIINETQAIAYVSDKNINQSDAFIKDEIYNFYNQQQQLLESQEEKQDKQLQQKQVQQIPQQQQQSIPSSGQAQLNEESKMHLDTNQDNLQYQHLQSENIQTILKEEEIKASTQQGYLVEVLEITKFQTPKTKNSKQQIICLEIAQLPCIYCYKISKNVKIEDFLDNQCHKYECQYKQCEKQNYIYIQDYKTPQSISVIMKKELKKKQLEDICKSYEQELKSGKHQQQIPESNPNNIKVSQLYTELSSNKIIEDLGKVNLQAQKDLVQSQLSEIQSIANDNQSQDAIEELKQKKNILEEQKSDQQQQQSLESNQPKLNQLNKQERNKIEAENHPEKNDGVNEQQQQQIQLIQSEIPKIEEGNLNIEIQEKNLILQENSNSNQLTQQQQSEETTKNIDIQNYRIEPIKIQKVELKNNGQLGYKIIISVKKIQCSKCNQFNLNAQLEKNINNFNYMLDCQQCHNFERYFVNTEYGFCILMKKELCESQVKDICDKYISKHTEQQINSQQQQVNIAFEILAQPDPISFNDMLNQI